MHFPLATIAIHPQAAAAVGALFTLLAARRVARSVAEGPAARAAEANRNVRAGALSGGVVAAGLAYHAVRWPDCMLCYTVASSQFVSPLVWFPVFVLALAACGALGAALADDLLAKEKPLAAAGVVALFGAAYLGCALLTFHSLSHLGTYEEFWSENALPLLEQHAAVVATLAAIGLTGAVLAAGAFLRWRKQRGARA